MPTPADPTVTAHVAQPDEDGLCWVTICDTVNGDGAPEHFSIRFDHAQQWAAQEVACRYEFSAPTLYPEG